MIEIDYSRDRIEAGRQPEPRQMEDGRPLNANFDWRSCLFALFIPLVLLLLWLLEVMR